MKPPSHAEISSLSLASGTPAPPVPAYLQTTYWWAYIHPGGVRIFERQWLVNLILWGNYRRLCNAALDAMGPCLHGRILQVACAYGELTPRLVKALQPDSVLDIIDVVPIQLDNLAKKLSRDASVRLHAMDSTGLNFADGHFDRVLLFFLLHEQPAEVRRRTLSEALRVTRSGGIVTIVDYAGPGRLNPLRYLMAPLLRWLEPYALELWAADIVSWLDDDGEFALIRKRRFFGGLYQVLTLEVRRPPRHFE